MNEKSSLLDCPNVPLLLQLLPLILSVWPLLLIPQLLLKLILLFLLMPSFLLEQTRSIDSVLESSPTCTIFPLLYEGWSEDSMGKRRRRDRNATMSPTEMEETL